MSSGGLWVVGVVEGLLFHLVFGVDDVVAAGLLAGLGGWAGGRARGLAGLLVQVLGHRPAGLVELGRGTLDRRQVARLYRLLDLVDRPLDRGLVRLRDLVGALLEQLLELEDLVLGFVLCVRQLPLP